MANMMYVQRISRLTLVRKGRGKAKHPDMQSGVVEVVKAAPAPAQGGGASVEGTPNLDRFRCGWQ